MKRKYMGVLLGLFIAMNLGAGTVVNAAQNGKTAVYVNDKLIPVETKVVDGKVYVPLKSFTESIGAEVQVNEKENTARIKTGGTTVSSLLNKLSPSVVGIIGKLRKSSQDYSSRGENLVFGTGVIYRSDGFIITNAHVVADMDTIVVVLSNGKAYKARLKAMDEKCDVAMIKIDKGGLTPAVFGDIKDIAAGESVIAIGTPLSFSLRNSATMGIISGLNRSAEGEYKFIQSDAAINGGNSGGPLVNMKGKVIGINTVKYTGFGIEGLSFSIPIDTVKYAISHFEKYGKIRRPYLGATFSEGVAAKYGLPSNEGLTVTEIESNSPAQKAGLKVEDMVIGLNKVKISTKIDYNEEMKKFLPGDTVVLTVIRGEKQVQIKVKCSESSNT
ncbi:MAG: trypsin-like peptidase domain-containing protein [Clostridia bacterium]|nr:trypsin-like peptidase domain-containing protein [Clostridia bacterium]